MTDDLLEGVDMSTPKSDLRRRLEAAVARLTSLELSSKKESASKSAENMKRFDEIESRVRAKWVGRTEDFVQLQITTTMAEMSEVAEFLGDFEDVLPLSMQRILGGARAATGTDSE